MTSISSSLASVWADDEEGEVGDALMSVDYDFTTEGLRRSISSPVGSSTFLIPADQVNTALQAETAWQVARLRGSKPVPSTRPTRRISIVDLFSGAGGMALGAGWAVEALAMRPKHELVVDVDAEAVEVNQFNTLARKNYVGSVRDLFSPFALRSALRPSQVDPVSSFSPGSEWLVDIAPVDLVIGGPPCQGHSSLNNHTRGQDDRNQLYYWMALAAHALRAKVVVIENVATVMADAGDVVGATHEMLSHLGYKILFADTLSADRMGVAQTRKRHFTVAIRSDVLGPFAHQLGSWLRRRRLPTVSIMDAIGDLEDVKSSGTYDAPSDLSSENRKRIDYLFDEDVYELPDHQRPESHRDGHTYPSVYGRLHADRPAGTLSTGFLSPGRGRYVHPTRRRTLTLHEGARLQGFPDDFMFVGASGSVPPRTSIARMIGDAVPPPLAFNVVLAALAATKEGAFG